MARRILSSSLFIILIACLASAQTLEDREQDYGFVVGYWTAGTVSVQGFEADKDGSLLLRVFADAYIMPKLAFGAYFNYAPYSQSGTDINALEFGGSIKPRFMIGEDVALKPGINFGYRWTSSDVSSAEIDAFGLNLSVELQKMINGRVFFGEFGFLSQPAGGNDLVDVTFAPIVYFGAGIVF